MKYLLIALLAICGTVACGSAASNTATTDKTSTANMDKPVYSGADLDKLTSNPKRVAVLQTKQGTIKIQLFDKVAPLHVANFIKLAKSGFYDGTTFHRLMPGFMIQGGDPNSKDDDLSNDGQGAPGQETVPAEFSKLHHARGILSAARRGNDVNSATSQFFICVADAGFLDNQYTIYGQVIEGMDVADKLAALPAVPGTSTANGKNAGKAAQITKVTIEE